MTLTPAKRLRAAVIAQLLKEGWRPPRPSDEQALRIIDDIVSIGGDRRRRIQLTDREREILELASEGNTKFEIADKLHKSPETVKDVEARIRRKLGARNTTHAVSIAIRDGVLRKAA